MTNILDYYDMPQLFVALDAVGTQYLCLFYDHDEAGKMKCIAVTISRDRLNDFITGHLDLRQVYLEPEMWLYDVTVDGNIIEATPRAEAPAGYMLPDEGYFLDYSQLENHDMVAASQEERKTIIRLAFNYETNNHAVPTGVLTGTVHNFQAIVSNAYKKLTKDRTGINSRLSVRAAIAASFDLELVANEPTNLFGGSKVADTLDMISPLFSDEDEAVANCLATFKNTQRNYKNLLKTLSDENISFKCKWVQGAVDGVVGECPVTKERVQSLYSLASNLQMLEETEELFEGSFFMANTRNGRWGLSPIGEKKAKYGVCTEVAKLEGIVLKNRVYRVKCTVRPTLNPNTGKEYKSYILTDIQKMELKEKQGTL
jgi:hypothetical protein